MIMLSNHLVSLVSVPNSPDTASTSYPSGTCSFVPVNALSNSSHLWIIDSGASKHICSNANPFSFLKPIWNSIVSLPNNTTIPIRLYRDIQLAPHFILKNVLFVPKFIFNLLSVSALTSDSDLTVNFFSDHFRIQDHHSSMMIGKGNKFQDLYILDSKSLSSTSINNVNLVSFPINNVPFQIWHNRLGHLSVKQLHFLTSQLHCTIPSFYNV